MEGGGVLGEVYYLTYILFRYSDSSSVTFPEHLQHMILTPFTVVTPRIIIMTISLHIMLD